MARSLQCKSSELIRVLITVLAKDYPFIYVDPKSVSLLDLARRAARAEISILITGASGSGKEVLAHVVHESSSRASGPFIALNCAAIPETLIESTLFGHVKGSFTGANAHQRATSKRPMGERSSLMKLARCPCIFSPNCFVSSKRMRSTG